MYKRYKDWTIRQASTAQCSPALGVVFLLAILGCTIYIYRHVIEDTLLIAAIAVLAVTIVAVIAGTIVTVLRHSKQTATASAPATIQGTTEPAFAVDGQTLREPATITQEDADAISAEADWLASGVELAFSPDGKKLVKKEG
jgi:hypothetical protein